ncbi:DUF2251 domain-containing protein, partial [Glaesserella parasuis]|nr:DUF2251 domain-containing protein [Glaesserella parasuis]
MLYSVLTDHIVLGEGYRNGAHSIKHE